MNTLCLPPGRDECAVSAHRKPQKCEYECTEINTHYLRLMSLIINNDSHPSLFAELSLIIRATVKSIGSSRN